MMSRLHVASWALLVGAAGQCKLYGILFPRFPSWIIFVALLPPWFTVYTISFCRRAPFGSRRFRHCLIFAMCWYAVMTLVGETLHVVFRTAQVEAFPNVLAQVLTYVGALSFIVFIRTCRVLRSNENARTSTPEVGID